MRKQRKKGSKKKGKDALKEKMQLAGHLLQIGDLEGFKALGFGSAGVMEIQNVHLYKKLY